MHCRGHRAGLLLATSFLAFASTARAGETVVYSYDALGRLTATSSNGTVNDGVTASIGHDPAGNRALYVAALAGPPVFSVSDVSVVEGGGLVFTVIKTGSSGASINYGSANGSAGAGGDYSALGGTLNFTPAETAKTVTITTIDDGADEPSETLSLNLSAPSPGASIADPQGIGTIFDNDEPPPPPPPPPPAFSVNDVSATEGGNLVFTVTKIGATTSLFGVGYATVNGTAYGTYNGGDFHSASGNLVFTAAETSKTVTVYGIDDFSDESDENFFLSLSSPSGGATLSDAQGIGTILDNDDPPPGNLAPTPADDSGTMRLCSTMIFNVTGNDTDPDGDTPLTVISVTGDGFSVASSSEVAVDSSTLTSASGIYAVRDQRGATATATLTITLAGGSCRQ
ncbi:MAG: hypothetical protein QOG72_3323 [Sphingomonadales bacterium]|nr:hypothetical protein [Sphingomonadales bacterium]